jgi:hypothetical protein
VILLDTDHFSALKYRAIPDEMRFWREWKRQTILISP